MDDELPIAKVKKYLVLYMLVSWWAGDIGSLGEESKKKEKDS